jgi:CheY-like chemotaxis protein
MRTGPGLDDVYLGGVSVLVVDDCNLVRATVAAMLEHYGATVTAVASADEALEALVRERPDVLVSDLAMPDKGGYWLIGQVRALRPERGGATPAAALTGFPVRSTAPDPARRVPVPHREAGRSGETGRGRRAPRPERAIPFARVNQGFGGAPLRLCRN